MIRPDVDDMIEFLNGMARLDPVFVINLIKKRVPCNHALADHPTIQVGQAKEWLKAKDARQAEEMAGLPPEQPAAGFLGVINGYYGSFDSGPYEGWGPITAEVDGNTIYFRRTDEGVTIAEQEAR